MDNTDDIAALKASVIALQMAVQVLYAYAPPQAKDDLKSMGDELLDRLLALPTSELQLERLAQSLSALHRKSS
jgi:hypothetical protein